MEWGEVPDDWGGVVCNGPKLELFTPVESEFALKIGFLTHLAKHI
jgi:hypothetical protein